MGEVTTNLLNYAIKNNHFSAEEGQRLLVEAKKVADNIGIPLDYLFLTWGIESDVASPKLYGPTICNGGGYCGISQIGATPLSHMRQRSSLIFNHPSWKKAFGNARIPFNISARTLGGLSVSEQMKYVLAFYISHWPISKFTIGTNPPKNLGEFYLTLQCPLGANPKIPFDQPIPREPCNTCGQATKLKPGGKQGCIMTKKSVQEGLIKKYEALTGQKFKGVDGQSITSSSDITGGSTEMSSLVSNSTSGGGNSQGNPYLLSGKINNRRSAPLKFALAKIWTGEAWGHISRAGSPAAGIASTTASPTELSTNVSIPINAEGLDCEAIKAIGGFANPASGYPINSAYGPRWGKFHGGIDIGTPTGTSIKASANGIVTYSATSGGGYGGRVVILHGKCNGKGIYSSYSHNSKVLIQKGAQVTKGQEIAKAGSTGYSTGPHLHFEIWATEKTSCGSAFSPYCCGGHYNPACLVADWVDHPKGCRGGRLKGPNNQTRC